MIFFKKNCIKTFASILFSIISLQGLYANTEFSFSYSNMFHNNSNLMPNNKSDIDSFPSLSPLMTEEGIKRKIFAPLGAEGTASFFVTSLLGIADIGLGVSGGYYTYNSCTLGESKVKLGSAYEYNFGAGPALRLNFGSRNSFLLTSEFLYNYRKLSLQSPDFDATQEERYLALSMNIGYRLWLYKRNNILAGLNVGTVFVTPMNSYCKFMTDNSSFRYKEEKTEVIRFYAGLSFNIGKRGVDK